MGATTKIEWCHATWSPWRGCTKVSEGCRHCYAERQSKRNPAVLGVWGPNGSRTVNADWKKPLAWDRAAAKAGERRRVFPSVCDWLEDRPDLDETLARFLALIDKTPNIDWLLLTKRPELFRKRLRAAIDTMPKRGTNGPYTGPRWNAVDWLQGGKPSGRACPPNVWLGVSVEDQATADARIPHLLGIDAAVRWVSYEPALGPVDFDGWLDRGYESGGPAGWVAEPSIDWIVVGGESGLHARPCNVDWIRSAVGQCKAAGVPVFVKQLGANVPVDLDRTDDSFPDGTVADITNAPMGRVRLRDPKGGDPAEWPEDLRVREFPAAREVA